MKVDLQKITPRQKLMIAKWLRDYRYIMDNWQTDDDDFRKVYYNFYLKARWAVMSKPGNLNPYFAKLQSISPEDDLMEIVYDLRNKTESRSYELSLASKLLHTRNPSSPIYDRKIRNYLFNEENVRFWWHIPNRDSGASRGTSEEEKIRHDWRELCNWYAAFMKSARKQEWVDWFDTNFSAYKDISDIKKIDFIIFTAQE